MKLGLCLLGVRGEENVSTSLKLDRYYEKVQMTTSRSFPPGDDRCLEECQLGVGWLNKG